MKRRNFFKGLLGLIGVGSSVFLLKDVSAEPKVEPPFYQVLRKSKAKPNPSPKIEWTKRRIYSTWIDVTGFNMDGVNEIVTPAGRFRHLRNMGLPYLWVRSNEYIEYKHTSFGIWELVKSGNKTYLHYQYHVGKLNR